MKAIPVQEAQGKLGQLIAEACLGERHRAASRPPRRLAEPLPPESLIHWTVLLPRVPRMSRAEVPYAPSLPASTPSAIVEGRVCHNATFIPLVIDDSCTSRQSPQHCPHFGATRWEVPDEF